MLEGVQALLEVKHTGKKDPRQGVSAEGQVRTSGEKQHAESLGGRRLLL